jgi:hypothetical protein
MNTNLYEKVAKRRAKAQRPLLLKFLQEIGYDDIFSVDEVKDIKALYDKAQEEMRANFEAELKQGDSYVAKLEENMLKAAEEEEPEEKPDSEAVPEVVDGQAVPQAEEAEKQEEAKDEEVVDARVNVKCEIRAHFDSVNSMHFAEQVEVLATASQDCTIKLWNTKNLQSSFPEPFFSLRGHTAPVLAITGPKQQDSTQSEDLSKVLFSADQDGGIRIWSIPSFARGEKYPQTYGKNFNVGQWKDGLNEPYWQLEYHDFLPLLLAVKSSTKVQVWDCKEVAERASKFN